MKVICTQENLRNGLSVVTKALPTNNSLPVLNTVLIETEAGQLKLSGTNLEMVIKVYVRCKTEIEGKVCIPAKVMNDLVSSLSKANNITLTLEGNDLTIVSGGLNAKIKTINPEDFPILPSSEATESVEFELESFKNALSEVVFAVSTNETQPEISGVLGEFKGDQLKLVATDRYRLVEKVIKLGKTVKDAKIIIPQKTINEFIRTNTGVNEKVTIGWSDTQISFVSGSVEILSRLIDSNYPDYEHIIPKNQSTIITVGRDDLVGALKTAGVFTGTAGTVKLLYGEGEVTLSSLSENYGQSDCVLECSLTGTSGEVMFNYKYVQDFLSVTDASNLVIKIINDSSPVIFEPLSEGEEKSYMYLVMPIKV